MFRSAARVLALALALTLAAAGAGAQPEPTWAGVATDGRLTPGAERGNWANVYFASWAASLTYRKPRESEEGWKNRVRGELKVAGFAGPDFPVRQAGAPGWIWTECFITSSPHVVLVAFRGTDSPRDWVGNVIQSRLEPLRSVPDPADLRAHGGFQDAADSVYSEVLATVARRSEGGKLPVWVTGHSLGGALAALVALRLNYHLAGRARVTVYSFSAPKIGNHPFPDRMAARVPVFFRLTYGRDVVPVLPPLGYDHVHQGYYFARTSRTGSSPKAAPQPHPEATPLVDLLAPSAEPAAPDARTALLKLERGEVPTPEEFDAMGKVGIFDDHGLDHLRRASYGQIPGDARPRFPLPP